MKELKLDRTDYRILSALQTNARITNQNLADKINLSPSSCLSRVRRLEETGYINQYYASLNLHKICRYTMCIATASIKSQKKQDFSEFEKQVNRIPEIIECYTVSGAFDFFLKIISTDMQSYVKLIDKLIASLECELNIVTHVVMSEDKHFQGLPLDSLV